MTIKDAIDKISRGDKFRFRLVSDGDIYKYIGAGSLYNETLEEVPRWIMDNEWLNEEIEIIEEEMKLPEKIDEDEIAVSMAIGEQMCAEKINEIIDYLKTKENK